MKSPQVRLLALACLAFTGGTATAACNSSFANGVGQVITGVLPVNGDACNLTYLVVRETGTLNLFDQGSGTFINGASDLSGNTWVQDAGLDNWGLLTNGQHGQFYNVRQLTNRGTVQNDGALHNLVFVLNLASFVNGATGTMTNAAAGDFENYADLTNRNTLNNDGALNNYARMGNDAGATLVSQGQFTNRTGGMLTNDGTTRLLGVSVLETGSTLTNTGTLDVGGSLLHQGQIFNTGTLNILADGGDGMTLTAGSSYDFTTGMLSVSGKLTLEADFAPAYAMLEHFEMKPGSVLVNRATFTPNEWASAMQSVTFHNEAGARLVVVGPLVLWNDIDHANAYFDNASGAVVEVRPAGTLSFVQPTSNAGTILNNGALYISQPTVNTTSGKIINAGYLDVNTVLTNDGSLTNSGTVKVVGPLPFHGMNGHGSYEQTAGTTQVDGDMAQGGVKILGGSLVVDGTLTTTADPAFLESTGEVELISGELSGVGRINGNLFVGRRFGLAKLASGRAAASYATPLAGDDAGLALFAPGHGAGSFIINGDFTLLPGGELDLDVARGSDGLLAIDHVSAQHMTLNGTVHFKIAAGLGNASWEQLQFLDCGGGCVFGTGFSAVIDGGLGSVSYSATGLTLNLAPAAVPEPTTGLLWLAGVAGLWMKRRFIPART